MRLLVEFSRSLRILPHWITSRKHHRRNETGIRSRERLVLLVTLRIIA